MHKIQCVNEIALEVWKKYFGRTTAKQGQPYKQKSVPALLSESDEVTPLVGQVLDFPHWLLFLQNE